MNWHQKGKLIFYNDEEDYIDVPKQQRPPKPRQGLGESEEGFQQRQLYWEATRPHWADVKPKGNSMRQTYYVDKILSYYIEQLHAIKAQFGRAILLEDNDPSHGTKTWGNIAAQTKRANQIELLLHPPYSGDLNPSESIWNVLDQRLGLKTWSTQVQFRQAIQEAWDEITIQEIRDRIKEMPERVDYLIRTGGEPVKSSVW